MAAESAEALPFETPAGDRGPWALMRESTFARCRRGGGAMTAGG